MHTKSSQSILVVGSVAFDQITTPTAESGRVLGGSATYASIAASYQTPVNLVGVVGNDFGDEHLNRLRAGPRIRCPTTPKAKRRRMANSRTPNSKGLGGRGSRTSKATPATAATEARTLSTMALDEIVAPVTETTF